MTDTARVLLTAAILSSVTISAFAWRVTRLDPMQPERLIGELRLAQWAAVLLAAVGAIPIGLTIGGTALDGPQTDAALGVVFVGLAGLVLQRDPREALLLASGSFTLHALLDIARRPGWFSPDIGPHWFLVGCAIYNVYLASVCYWARR